MVNQLRTGMLVKVSVSHLYDVAMNPTTNIVKLMWRLGWRQETIGSCELPGDESRFLLGSLSGPLSRKVTQLHLSES